MCRIIKGRPCTPKDGNTIEERNNVTSRENSDFQVYYRYGLHTETGQGAQTSKPRERVCFP